MSGLGPLSTQSHTHAGAWERGYYTFRGLSYEVAPNNGMMISVHSVAQSLKQCYQKKADETFFMRYKIVHSIVD